MQAYMYMAGPVTHGSMITYIFVGEKGGNDLKESLGQKYADVHMATPPQSNTPVYTGAGRLVCAAVPSEIILDCRPERPWEYFQVKFVGGSKDGGALCYNHTIPSYAEVIETDEFYTSSAPMAR
ncbi:hypothetical protein Btru_031635 [Bulinus truncatus]|nr:hypothetical protein Btru_031635 [Bulinus truncatus]